MRRHLSKFFLTMSMWFWTEGERRVFLTALGREADGWKNLNEEWKRLNEDQKRLIELRKTFEAVAAEKNIDLTRPTRH